MGCYKLDVIFKVEFLSPGPSHMSEPLTMDLVIRWADELWLAD